MQIDVHIHLCQDPSVIQLLKQLLAKVDLVITKEGTIMAAIDDLEAKVAAQETVEASAITLLQGLKTELDAALATGDTARLQALSAKIDTDTQALAAAVAANTPAAPTT